LFIGIAQPDEFMCIIYPILCEPWFPINDQERPRQPAKPPRRFAGFDSSSLKRIAEAQTLAERLLFGFEGDIDIDGTCLGNLSANGIDGTEVARILAGLRVKPNTADETVMGDYDVFNGDKVRFFRHSGMIRETVVSLQ
jgi:hypothetical protein